MREEKEVRGKERRVDSTHWTKSLSVYFSLWFEILNIWFTITLSGLGPELWCRGGFSVCFVVYGFEILIFCCRVIRLSGLGE